MNEMIVKWNPTYTKGITLRITTRTNTSFSEDHVIIADTGDNLQREVRNI